MDWQCACSALCIIAGTSLYIITCHVCRQEDQKDPDTICSARLIRGLLKAGRWGLRLTWYPVQMRRDPSDQRRRSHSCFSLIPDSFPVMTLLLSEVCAEVLEGLRNPREAAEKFHAGRRDGGGEKDGDQPSPLPLLIHPSIDLLLLTSSLPLTSMETA